MKYTEIEPIRKLLARCEKVYVVGGHIRDSLLGIHSNDIDIVIDRDPKEVIPGNCFPLDEERGIYRCIYKELTLDISRCQGRDIIEDLKARDYTVNAIAYDLKSNCIIDPLQGTEDVKKGVIRAISCENLLADPIRLLRGIRIWLTHPFRIEKKTEETISQLAPHLSKAAPERVKDELIKILSHPISSKAILKMAKTNLLDVIFPPLKECRGLFQGKFFGRDLREHLIYCYRCCEILINFIPAIFEDESIIEPLNTSTEHGVSAREVLKLSALLHDVGKPKTFAVRNGKYTFWEHDKIGAKIAEKTLQKLCFSTKSCQLASILVENHMRLHLLARAGEITDRAKGRFFRKLKEKGVLTVFLSLSDSYASSGDLGLYYLFPYAIQMLDFYITFTKSESLQKPLLNGHDVMKMLGIGPGPMVGKILEALLEAQTEGIIKTKEEAKKFVEEVFGQWKEKRSSIQKNIRGQE